ncbi:MAG: DUF2817 domain-containing protein [Phycisphaerae bacterium]
MMAVGCASRLSGPPPRPIVANPAPAPTPRRVVRPAPVPKPLPPPERQVVVGHSVEGRPLTLSIFGDGHPAIFIMAGIHGDEPNSVDLAEALLAFLRAHPETCRNRTVGILPNANPDGRVHHTRTNVNRVDLNRNFPAANWRPTKSRRLNHGSHAASEPETVAIRRAIDTVRPDVAVSIHAISGGRQCNNYDGPGRDLADLLGQHNGYPSTGDIGYPTPGSFGSWLGRDEGIPTITLELPRGSSDTRCLERNRRGLVSLIRSFDAATATVPPAPARDAPTGR